MTKPIKKGDMVMLVLIGFGAVTREGPMPVLRVDKRGIWVSNGSGNDPYGPYDPRTLTARDGVPGFTAKIERAHP